MTNIFSQKVNINEWQFREDKVGSKRLSLLLQSLPYSAIAQRIANQIKNIGFRPAKGDKEAKDKKRAEFYFSVDSETLDLFFNGSQGYRAQYYLDPERGIESNRFVIDLLKGKLIEAANRSHQTILSLEQVEKSLECKSAKIWINENHSTLDQTSHDADEIVALKTLRWVEALRQVLAAWDRGQRPDPQSKTRRYSEYKHRKVNVW